MAKQLVNCLRSMGLVEEKGDEFAQTNEGRGLEERAVEEWADSEWTPSAGDSDMSVGSYETVVTARAVDPEFRATVIAQHDRTCPVSGVDHPGLLDVAHVLFWSDYPDHRADLANVLPLSKTHHVAFDRGLFTFDQEYRLRVNPSFDTQSGLLQRTILERGGEQVPVLEGSLETAYLAEHNAELAWV